MNLLRPPFSSSKMTLTTLSTLTLLLSMAILAEAQDNSTDNANVTDILKPEACRNVQVTGFIENPDEDKQIHYWCYYDPERVKNPLGRELRCAEGYVWINNFQSCVRAYLVASLFTCNVTLGNDWNCTNGLNYGSVCGRSIDGAPPEEYPGTAKDGIIKVKCERSNGGLGRAEWHFTDVSSGVGVGVDQSGLVLVTDPNALEIGDLCNVTFCGEAEPCDSTSDSQRSALPKLKCICKDGWENENVTDHTSPCTVMVSACIRDNKDCGANGWCINSIKNDTTPKAECQCVTGWKDANCTTKRKCSQMEVPQSKVNNIEQALGETILVTCNEGHKINGGDDDEKTFTCSEDGPDKEIYTADGNSFQNITCDKVTCQKPYVKADTDEANATSSIATIASGKEEYEYAEEIIVSCNGTGYYLAGGQADGRYKCAGGGNFFAVDDDDAKILEDVCVENKCSMSALTEILDMPNDHGAIVFNGVAVGPAFDRPTKFESNSSVEITCREGYQIQEGKTKAKYVCDGVPAAIKEEGVAAALAAPAPLCVIIQCPDLSEGKINTNFTDGVSQVAVGGTVTITCVEGFTPYPPEKLSVTCNPDGTYDDDLAECQVPSCVISKQSDEQRTITVNGDPLEAKNDMYTVPVGSAVKIVCPSGNYTLGISGITEKEFHCIEDTTEQGRFNGSTDSIPFCVPVDDCVVMSGNDQCGGNAQCVDKEGDFECQCLTGWERSDAFINNTKSGCTEQIDPCQSSPCTNVGGATRICVSNPDYNKDGITNQYEYKCECNTGFSGYHCQKNANGAEPSCASTGFNDVKLPDPRSCTSYLVHDASQGMDATGCRTIPCTTGFIYDPHSDSSDKCELPAEANILSNCTRNAETVSPAIGGIALDANADGS